MEEMKKSKMTFRMTLIENIKLRQECARRKITLTDLLREKIFPKSTAKILEESNLVR